jgi:hypothetical protein
MIRFLEDGVRHCGQQQDRAVGRGGEGRHVVLPHPAGDEGDEGQPEQEVEVRPQDLAVDPVAGVEHVMVVVPVDAQEEEAQHVAQEDREQRPEREEVRAVRHLQLQDHDRDQDGDHPVAERLHASLGHGLS